MNAPYYEDAAVTLHHGDALAVLRTMPDASVNCCVTSPPYFGLRDYGTEGQYGLEATPAEYVETMRALFAEVRRVLADDGTLWLNLGDSYASSQKGGGGKGSSTLGVRATGEQTLTPAGILRAQDRQHYDPRKFNMDVPSKNLLGIPWRTAFALQDDGWILRNDVIWAKPNAMPESVTDRLSTRHEHLFMFSKRARYWFDLDAIREPLIHPDKQGHTFDGNNPEISRTRGGTYAVSRGATPTSRNGVQPGNTMQRDPGADGLGTDPLGRNPGDVWLIPTVPFASAHFACMPLKLAERAILAGCKPGGTVLDPFSGSGTTGLAATKHGRKYVGIDLSAEYLDLSLRTRFGQPGLDFDWGIPGLTQQESDDSGVSPVTEGDSGPIRGKIGGYESGPESARTDRGLRPQPAKAK